MEYKIVPATENDKAEILSLYKAQIGRENCPWTEDYPSSESIDFDLKRDALFVLKTDGKIKAAISLEEDEDVEVARVAVLPEAQNKGLGRIMMQYAMDELKRRGYKGIHILVNKHNIKAIRCYEVFGFNTVGECHMYEQDFLCYERKL